MKYQKEYFGDGFMCPYCGEHAVESVNEPVNHGSIITQDVECGECTKNWKEVYELKAMKKIKVPEVIAEKSNCESCDGNGYLEVTREDNCQYIEACDTCDHFGIIGDTDSIAREVAESKGYKLDKNGKILE